MHIRSLCSISLSVQQFSYIAIINSTYIHMHAIANYTCIQSFIILFIALHGYHAANIAINKNSCGDEHELAYTHTEGY